MSQNRIFFHHALFSVIKKTLTDIEYLDFYHGKYIIRWQNHFSNIAEDAAKKMESPLSSEDIARQIIDPIMNYCASETTFQFSWIMHLIARRIALGNRGRKGEANMGLSVLTLEYLQW